MKRILNIIFWILLVAGLGVTLAFVGSAQKEKKCTSLNIDVNHDDGNYFIESDDVKSLIYDTGDSIIGRPLAKIDILHLEKLINNVPAVKYSEVFKTINGEVKIKVEQRSPLLRIFSNHNESFYVDQEGFIMPLSSNYTARILIASGNINIENDVYKNANIKLLMETESFAEKSILDDLFLLGKYINEDKWRKAQFQQIYVNDNREIELIPRVGNHKILIGDISDLEEKMNKLMVFYKKGLSKTGWNDYHLINLKFKNQIVCTKKM